MKTAQILIIGDEILSGRTADSNSGYLAKALHTQGVRVCRIEVIADNRIAVSQWVHDNHGQSDYVLVCGGIGGTPDDITREAVARGVGTVLERHPAAERLLLDYYKEKANPERMGMADLPLGCELISNPVTLAPGFKIKNIYVMAGVPEIMHAMFESIRSEFQGPVLFEEEIKLSVGEGEIARFMKQLNEEFPDLELGSYPRFNTELGYKTLLVFRAYNPSTVKKAVKKFQELTGARVQAK